ncbi:oligoendopeptidase F [Streptobacillus moniliformis]|uniref:Oligopeptidase F n=1 Tax=Streptobacillus moniliformis (strain ATCC 14647 / DSM 12112 / NCTC 10651 / 9901) TaxID=519441 RepID=D1AV22_STRM9|nr:oligoendopeptidase F [Streptobacillus moniliformis]ACZ01582.1 oligoendopeptidase F [Streptobacillus moniliformis DSM 12112]AVL43423.1 oligoendopeptidase F [Streptobacillus moniliformis]SQA13250.1 Oligoendopeptidase F, plasmid [Streptobacillus moniliformis]
MEKILKRSEVDINKTWDLTTIFENDASWEKEFEKLYSEIESISKFEETMIDDVNTLADTLDLDDKLNQRIMLLYTYAHLKGDEDTGNSKYQEYNAKIMKMYSDYDARSTFIRIKLLELSEEKVEEYFSHERLVERKFEMEKLFKTKKHQLSQKEEELLANMAQITGVSSKAFSMLNNADITFEEIENSKGEKLSLNHARYGMYMESSDRKLRENAYNSMYKTYKGLKNTFATTLEGQVLAHTTNAKLRNYSSARNAAVSSNFIDEGVYDSLLSAVNDKISTLHKYVEFRKEQLGFEELKMYDMYTPLLKEVELNFTYEEAKEIIIEALQVLGQDYVKLIKKAFDERWIDYAENEGKRSGAYSSGTYGTNPFILISWRGTLDNLFTLIHELGHSIHSYYTRNYQPYIYGHYTIFLAEVASITNELILNDFLIKKYEDNPVIKAYIINHYLDKVKGTVFRQTQFAEFEYEIHRSVEEGQPLTAEYLSNLYENLNKKYYGEAITYDDNIRYEWARIPHFYYNFYVYQYATGMSAASAFAKKILTEGRPAVEKYINYLKSGASDYSLNILKNAGVDMNTNAPVYACLETFQEKLEELQKVLKEI